MSYTNFVQKTYKVLSKFIYEDNYWEDREYFTEIYVNRVTHNEPLHDGSNCAKYIGNEQSPPDWFSVAGFILYGDLENKYKHDLIHIVPIESSPMETNDAKIIENLKKSGGLQIKKLFKLCKNGMFSCKYNPEFCFPAEKEETGYDY